MTTKKRSECWSERKNFHPSLTAKMCQLYGVHGACD